MKEVTVGQNQYSIGKMDAIKQFHVSRRLVPVLASFATLGAGSKPKEMGVSLLLPMAEALGKMSDEDTEYIIYSCMSVVRRLDQGGWQSMLIGGVLTYQDLSMTEMIKLTTETIMENMGDFFDGLQTS